MNTSDTAAKTELILQGSRHFNAWLFEQKLSLALTTYQAGKLFLIGLKPDATLSVFERSFARSMGLWGDGQTLWLASLYQLWRFENTLLSGQDYQGHDRLYVPQVGYTIGDVDVHDVGVDSHGRVVFVNTLFSCLAGLSERYSFEPLWRPPFISKLAAEDRCHLNGLAIVDGAPGFVTCVSMSDVNSGWRDARRDGGVVIDVRNNEIVVSGLSMPHSPRWHRGKLWLLNAGSGEFGYIDFERARFEPVAFCPGYLRGLSFYQDYAVVGLSLPRENRTFSGLQLDEYLTQKNVAPRCALQIIDLQRGDVVHELRIEGVVTELYDVVVLPGVQRPAALGFRSSEIQRLVSLAPEH